MPLDERANYNPRGVPVRACAHCYGQFKQWRSSNSRASNNNNRGDDDNSSVASSSVVGGEDGGASPGGGSPLSASPIGCKGKPTPPSVAAEVAVSVPRDWNWSTF